MLETVYFIPVERFEGFGGVSAAAGALLRRLLTDTALDVRGELPVKVHFGEKGNTTFIPAAYYDGLLDVLRAGGAEPFYIETNVLYRGQRTHRADHERLAVEHGFTQVPVRIADGESGEAYTEVEINAKHFRKCKVGELFSHYDRMLVVSHFKGHVLAGFGGALKQLAMGCAARGGKMDQHARAVPLILPWKCHKCHVCERACPVGAIHIGAWPRISKTKCIGCAACIAKCPHGAVTPRSWNSLGGGFIERLTEYAYAAQKGKRCLYLSFALNLTWGCDCQGQTMRAVAPDLGILACTDPIAIDQACLDLLDARPGRRVYRRGRQALAYGEKLGMGSRTYTLQRLDAP